jgi:hypothetical protein
MGNPIKEEENAMNEALSEPPFCAWCGGTCQCDEYSDREDLEYWRILNIVNAICNIR